MYTKAAMGTAGTEASGDRLLRGILLGGLMLAVHVMAAGACMVIMLYVVPRYVSVYVDFEVDLSAATVAVIEISNAVISYWYLMLMGLVVVDGGLLLALQFLPRGLAFVKWLWFFFFLMVIVPGTGLAMWLLQSTVDSLVVEVL